MDEDDLKRLYDADKTLPTDVGWERSQDERHLKLSSAIAIDGLTIEGLILQAQTPRTHPDRAVCFQLMAIDHATRRYAPFCRLEWRPLKPHNNKNLGPQSLRNISQKTSHLHCYDENRKLGRIWRERNLPVAIPIDPEPKSYKELLDFTREFFKILNVISVPEPPWERDVLL